ncbi:hypothetical protein PHET_02809 [Paragonimus heterotremus]|uniref:Secreted protein n=1 Tax=Paragonimus heterotremus TaxID=100268 RepID=A0A8J4TJB1_9TREM|nr:hypothetical protein PHET_02809 [Paragonimus heterotremus]
MFGFVLLGWLLVSGTFGYVADPVSRLVDASEWDAVEQAPEILFPRSVRSTLFPRVGRSKYNNKRGVRIMRFTD